MNLTYYPYRPFEIPEGEVVVLETGATKVFNDLIDGFREEKDGIRLSSDDFELLELSKSAVWYGDPKLELDLDHQFIRLLIRKISRNLDPPMVAKVMDEARLLSTIILENSYALDLPLEVTSQMDLESIIKMTGLHFSEFIKSDCYAKIETLFKTLVELDDHHLVVLANVSHYLPPNQLRDVVKLIKSCHITTLLIEFSNSERNEMFASSYHYWIDEDFNDARGETR